MSTWEARFWKHTDVRGSDDCWLWTGAKTSRGYGHLNVNGIMVRAHRLAWIMHYGNIPDGLLVCHCCDNPLCVNPTHLFLGTNQDNANDKVRKGRAKGSSLPGEANGGAKLTWEAVRGIRARLREGACGIALAQEYGVDRTTIYSISRQHSWRGDPATLESESSGVRAA